jgi:hypothetical protein
MVGHGQAEGNTGGAQFLVSGATRFFRSIRREPDHFSAPSIRNIDRGLRGFTRIKMGFVSPLIRVYQRLSASSAVKNLRDIFTRFAAVELRHRSAASFPKRRLNRQRAANEPRCTRHPLPLPGIAGRFDRADHNGPAQEHARRIHGVHQGRIVLVNRSVFDDFLAAG